MMQSDDVDEEREVVGADDAEAAAVGAPEEHRGDGGAGQADQAEPGDRHALAGLTEGFREHRGGPGQRDDQQRNDGGVVSHGRVECPVNCSFGSSTTLAGRRRHGTLTFDRVPRRAPLHLRRPMLIALDDALDGRLHRPQEQVRHTRP